MTQLTLTELQSELAQLKKERNQAEELVVAHEDDPDDALFDQIYQDYELFETAIADYTQRVKEAKKAETRAK